jgi:hypothetical protein
MRNASRRGSAAVALWVTLATTTVVALVSVSAVVAQTARVEELVSAVVRVNTHINPEGRTVQGLGREREGSGNRTSQVPNVPTTSIGRMS